MYFQGKTFNVIFYQIFMLFVTYVFEKFLRSPLKYSYISFVLCTQDSLKKSGIALP